MPPNPSDATRVPDTARPTLVFATRNRGKLVELRALLAELPIEVKSLDEIAQEVPEVEEDGDSFEANASKKALEVSRATGLPALADDSGLEIDALGGDPGVNSARYAGEHGDDEANNDKVLRLMAEVPDGERNGRFRSVLALADVSGQLGQDVLTSAGACEGQILAERRGTGGFGYDPLFFSPALGVTFAEAGLGTKNDLSHRAHAMRAMKPILIRYFGLANPRSSG